MPIYEYRCKDCDEVTEVMQKVGEGTLRKCRSCAGRLEKLVSRTSFLLKGGGWYSEGYHKDSSSKSKTPSSSSSKSKETKNSTDGKTGSGGSKKKASSA